MLVFAAAGSLSVNYRHFRHSLECCKSYYILAYRPEPVANYYNGVLNCETVQQRANSDLAVYKSNFIPLSKPLMMKVFFDVLRR